MHILPSDKRSITLFHHQASQLGLQNSKSFSSPPLLLLPPLCVCLDGGNGMRENEVIIDGGKK